MLSLGSQRPEFNTPLGIRWLKSNAGHCYYHRLYCMCFATYQLSIINAINMLVLKDFYDLT